MINDIQLAKYSDIEAIINKYLRDKFVGKSVIVQHYKDDLGEDYSDRYSLYLPYDGKEPINESGIDTTIISKIPYNYQWSYSQKVIEDAYIKADGEYEDYGLYVFIKCEDIPVIITERIEEIDSIKVCNI
jgi:hypothetical protein